MKIEMKGKRFGRWTVLREAGRESSGGVTWECVCECGAKKNVSGRTLRKGQSKSCGCLKRDLAASRVGNKNPHWKGGKYINDAGYVMVYDPSHKRAMANGYVREHIMIAEAAFGAVLPASSQVHHYGHVSDNSKLVICEDQEYHLFLHIRSRALNACGDANKRKCKFCHKYDSVDNLKIKQSNLGHGWYVAHKECAAEYEKNRDRRAVNHAA